MKPSRMSKQAFGTIFLEKAGAGVSNCLPGSFDVTFFAPGPQPAVQAVFDDAFLAGK